MNTSIDHEAEAVSCGPFVKWLLFLLLFLALFGFFMLRQVRLERLELNSIAMESIVTPVDFTVVDEEATQRMRQAAMAEVGIIYQIEPSQVAKLTPPSDEPNERQWLSKLQQKLWQLRFTDPVTADQIARIDPSQQENIIVISFFSLERSMLLPRSFWLRLNFDAPVSEQWLGALEKKLWRLQVDTVFRQRLQKVVEEKVPQQDTHVEAGALLVRQGEQITARQLLLVQAMQKSMGREHEQLVGWRLLASALLSGLLLGGGFLYLRKEYPSLLTSRKQLFLLTAVVILSLVLAKALDALSIMIQAGNFLRLTIFAPFLAILLSALFDRRLALFGGFWGSIIFGIGLSNPGLPLFLANVMPACVAILLLRFLYRRKAIFVICLQACLVATATMIATDLYFLSLSSDRLLADLLNALFFLLLTAVLVIALLPLFESLFDVLTEMTLMEYIDPAHPLLRRLMLEAPGTYQHSVIVGNLSEAAALAIGANGLFCRVSTLYHDIGKLIAPQYFTENQLPGINMHQLLTPLESAQVILSHVPEGVAMARKAGLPKSFISIIKEHHGTQLVYYFYHKQVEQLLGRADHVNEADFRYEGPKPRSKESAIIMIADSLEAAARSLDAPDAHTVTRLVEKLVIEKADEGQFEDCNLTFEELKTVKATLVHTLITAGHLRVKYPKKLETEELPNSR